MKKELKLLIISGTIFILTLICTCLFLYVKSKSNLTPIEQQEEIVEIQDSDLDYSVNRNDYLSDEEFSNFRQLKGGDLKLTIYRGASPVDNSYNRAFITDRLIKENHINYIINLSNNKTNFNNMVNSNGYQSSYTYSLYKENKVYLGGVCIEYDSIQYAKEMAKSLVQIINNDGPFYIHCRHGRDRTGMACIILESLANASYQEILDDYMKTFENYNKISKTSNSEMYNILFKGKFQKAISYITRNEKITNYATFNYKQAAENFLKYGGLTDNEINALKQKLTNNR